MLYVSHYTVSLLHNKTKCFVIQKMFSAGTFATGNRQLLLERLELSNKSGGGCSPHGGAEYLQDKDWWIKSSDRQSVTKNIVLVFIL